jgi:hypothetical protein
MELPEDINEREQFFNNLSKDLFKIDFSNSDFQFVMFSSLLSLLIQKGVITEDEFAKATEETGDAFKIMKFRNNILTNTEDEV